MEEEDGGNKRREILILYHAGLADIISIAGSSCKL